MYRPMDKQTDTLIEMRGRIEKTLNSIEVGEGGTSRRRAVGRRSALPPTEGRAEGQRSKVEGQSRRHGVKDSGSKSVG